MTGRGAEGGEAAGPREAGRHHERWRTGHLQPLGRRVWVVMGGGGLKGLAHVGAWQAVEEAGLEPA
ncbi:MAG: patatin-like phospholipase family protein, partial [Gemmatimonadota bacterium]